jgi:hypothetical protein
MLVVLATWKWRLKATLEGGAVLGTSSLSYIQPAVDGKR